MNMKQDLFLRAMITESTLSSAAKKAGINRDTAYKYLKNETFKKELNRLRSECLSDATRYLQANLTTASEKLIEIIKNKSTSASVKVQAINCLFSNYKSMIETEELTARLDTIEQMINERGVA